jgi:hypothetical protein
LGVVLGQECFCVFLLMFFVGEALIFGEKRVVLFCY